ncbi:peptide ABC transporter permease [Sphaerisporangium krabiense]|uniref:Oligopeptide transport system permease protein n=1 Tax=Sphaerisporangium krabiense TaxID=763782 RepID=A0A7W9DQ03_9ACTN|nr:ABC transporter permease [Sphaerisporangium krabiense]MBB5627006.1 oligopeptide transport system permease protein [Sphaerisporangium krabiense]GII65158.1 peptide ABC transporter permease [Sphaerisporangium krabiense]
MSNDTLPAAAPAAPPAKPVKPEKPASLWSDAWYDLRRNPVFIIGALMVAIFVLISAFPGLFDTVGVDPSTCQLADARKTWSSAHWFGSDNLGCDVYSRVIHGARVSILVGFISAGVTGLIGGLLGLLAGFYGRWVDVILSRVAEIFFAIPSILGALLILAVVGRDNAGIGSVVLALSLLAWPMVLRIMRAAVITAKHQDYVVAARALGAGPWRIMLRHILPNAIAPVIVVSTINLGAFIAGEAALSFLGVGIQSPQISWGLMIADARNRFLEAPLPLLFPALFLSLTILSVVMLGDAVRDALDPKLR